MNNRVAEGLCETVGQVCHLQNAPTEDGGSFMRVRVLVDISQPLCRGRVIAFDDSRERWVTFKYERLPNLCYWCRCLTHSDKDCDLWIESEGTLPESEKQYGSWIKASPFNGKSKSVLSVPGFYASKTTKQTGEQFQRPTRHAPAAEKSTWSEKATQPEMESTDSEMASNPQVKDTSLAGKATANLSPSNPEVMPHSTHMNDFQDVLEDIDRDLSKYDLPLPENNSHNIPTQNITHPTSPHNIPKTNDPTSHAKVNNTSSHNTHDLHYPTPHPKCPPTSPISLTPLSDISNQTIPSHKKANSTLNHNTMSTQYHANTSKNSTTTIAPPKPLSDISNMSISPKKANPTLTHDNIPTQYHAIPSKNSTSALSPPKPLSETSFQNVTPQNKTNLTTWKRLLRNGGVSHSDTLDILGQKRPANNHADHTGLPNKKMVVSQLGKENVQILAEAVQQPCQKQ